MKRGRPRNEGLLTPREWDVIELIGAGLTNEQIAVRLGISANTVKFHVSEILSKLGVSTREEAVLSAGRRRGLRAMLPLPLGRLRGKAIAASGLALAAVLVVISLRDTGIASQAETPASSTSHTEASADLAPADPVSLLFTICIDDYNWRKPGPPEQRAQVERDGRYSPWNQGLEDRFAAQFHIGASPATGRPNPLGKLVLFSGLWTAGSSREIYAALEAGCPAEPRLPDHPNIVDVWLLGHAASGAVLKGDQVVITVKPRATGFQAIQLRFPGPVAHYGGLIDVEDASGRLLAQLR